MRLLLPLSVAALVAAVLVATASFFLGRSWALGDVNRRYEAVRQTLANSSFPLSTNVVESIARLTRTELITVSYAGEMSVASLPIDGNPDWSSWLNSALSNGQPGKLTLDGKDYWYFRCQRAAGLPEAALFVLVLFDVSDIEAASRRAALLPLFTGISTVVLMATVTVLIARGMTGRLKSLQQRVSLISNGDFDARCNDTSSDEIGLLSQAIDSMAAQLKDLWQQVHNQQSAKLLHQLAGGMAHQLRNTLTGSRMAMELYSRKSGTSDDEEIVMALRQLEAAEQYVQRLLLLGQGQVEESRPANVGECLMDIRQSVSSVAKHLNKQLDWNLEEDLSTAWIADGPSFTAAVSNLVLNGIQACRQQVHIQACRMPADNLARASSSKVQGGVRGQMIIKVVDDGPGIDQAVRQNLFEPFRTTKPEGMGLGLPTVRRAAERLRGQVNWYREAEQTVFELVCACEQVSR